MPTKTKPIRFVIISIQIALLGLIGFVLLRHSPHAKAASTITVTTQSDVAANDGECSLREAITSANNDTVSGAAVGECVAGSGTDTIEFNITGPADFTNGGQNGYTLQPQTNYPNISAPLTINGYSQPGSLANTATAPNPMNGRLLIELDGSLGSNLGALNLQAGSDGSLIKGLVINNFGGGVAFVGTNDSALQGSYLGTDPTGQIAESIGTDDTSSAVAVTIGGGVSGETDTTTNRILVGGTNPADRNVISGNYGGAFGISSVDNTVQGNYIGLAADGVTALGNSFGNGVTTGNLTIDYADGLLVGGDDPGAANVISAGSTGGLQPDYSTNLRIIKNFIGTDYTGTLDRGNLFAGISFAYTSFDSEIRGNTIAYNQDNGIVINDDSQNISVISNSIHDNEGMGISFDYNGVIPNDALDPDTGSNNYLNYPDNLIYEESGGNTDLTYSLDVPAGDYRIEFFSNTTTDPSGNGEGETYLGFQNITSTGTGSQNFTHTVTGTSIPNISTTATFIDEDQPSGFGYTSTFSAIAELPPPPPPVSDLSLTKTLLNPQDVAVGAQLQYEFVVTNNGPDDFDLANMTNQNLGSDSLVLDIMPPDLSYVSSSDPDVDCASLGEGSASFLGPTLANHADYELLGCGYTDTHVLSSGESFNFTLTTQVKPESDLSFINYAFISPAVASNDPDTGIFQTAFGSGEDIVDYLGDNPINNFAMAAYQPASVPTLDVADTLPKVGAGLLAVLVATLTATTFGFRRRRLKS